MIVFTACWENNESFIESSNVCMKHDSDSKPYSLKPATIFFPESHKTKKTFFRDFILIKNIVQFFTECVPGNGRTLSTALHCSKPFESYIMIKFFCALISNLGRMHYLY